MGSLSKHRSRRAGLWLDLLSLAAMVALPLFALATLAGCAATTHPAPPPREARILRDLSAMGTALQLEVHATDRPTARLASEAAVRALAAVEALLSTWRPDSELSRINALEVGVRARISAELSEALRLALQCSTRTGGAFDPTVAPLVKAWGLRQGGRQPTEQALALAREEVGTDRLSLEIRALQKRAPVSFEEGAFGKGLGLDRAIAAAVAAGASEVTIDLGGQISHAPGERGHPRWIPLAHPDHRDQPLVEVQLQGGSLATSGNGQRSLVVDGRPLGHLLDPHTGLPVPDFGSLTVLAATGLEADCLSTGLYVLGPERALAFAEQVPGVEVVIVDTARQRPEVTHSSGVILRALSRPPPGELQP